MTTLTTIASTRDASLCRRDKVAYARGMSNQLEDSALMLRYREGDIAAFETLYRRHNDSLYRYLLRLSANRQTAEDVFQDAWSKVIKARRNYRPTAKFSTYLFRVAHNCFIDYVRRNKRHGQETNTDPDLSPDQGLHEEGGLSIDDIGFVTGANRETAKSRLRYAVAKLKSEMAKANVTDKGIYDE
jgi:RNA polymerase sigma-70 factor (ECF subfamily)